MTPAPHLDPESIELHAQGRGAAGEHLNGCAACREAVAHARARRTLLSALQPPELSDFALARVERQLFEAPRPRARGRWLLAMGLAIAVVLIAVGIRGSIRSAPVPGPSAPLAKVMPLTPARPLAPASVVLVEGTVEEEGKAVWRGLDPADSLWQGSHLRTGEGRLALSFGPGRGLVLEPHSELLLELAQRGNLRATLLAGQVSCATTPLSAEESFAVQAGPRLVRVVGTAFAVTRGSDRVLLEVQHGTVLVSGLSDATGVRVPGPGALDASDAAAWAALSPRVLGADEASELDHRSAWRWATGAAVGRARLDVVDLPEGAQVELDEDGWGPAPVAAWLAPGPHTVRARVTGEPERIMQVSLSADGPATRVSPPRAAVSPPRSRRQPAISASVVKALRGVERAHHRELTYCYEHALKVNPTLEGNLVLSLSLTSDGAVQNAQATFDDGAPLPDELSECILASVRAWDFPPESPRDFELPLALQAK